MISEETVEWHKDRLESQQDYLDVLKHRQYILQKEIDTYEKELKFYKLQIETAQKKGKVGFDADHYLKNKIPSR